MKKYISAICILAIFVALLVELPFFQHILSAHAAPAAPASKATPAQARQATSSSAMSFVHACSQASAGSASCMAMMSTTTVQPTFATPVAHPMLAGGGATPAAATGSAAPYGPTALHNAYNLPMTTATSQNQTVAIVDAFDDPNAETDLATYRSMFGLPACTTANGCFQKVNQTGGATPPAPNAQWAVEISLDLDMASAVCTNCKILLVEATSNSFTDLGTAVNEAVTLGATAVSNSYGGTEVAGDVAGCSQFYSHAGVVVTASSGDASLSLNSPADCPNVVAVGGTTLNPNGTETAWNTSATAGAGGGCSAQIPLPTWQVQTVTNCAMRAIADVSAVADPNTGVFVEDTYQQGGGLQVGGTSASSPLVAAVYALAGGTPNATSAAMVPWANHANNCLNVVGGTTYGFQTGLGSPNGLNCF